MKLKVWVCEDCGKETKCVLSGSKNKTPSVFQYFDGEKYNSCPYEEGMGATFELREIEDTELIKYF